MTNIKSAKVNVFQLTNVPMIAVINGFPGHMAMSVIGC